MARQLKIGLGIPLSWPFCHSDFFDSFTVMEKLQGHVIRASSGPICEMRNNIVVRALELGCTHLMFLDADMIYPPDTIPRLLAHDKHICGGLCFKRWPPFIPTLFVGDKYEMTLMDPYPEGLVKVTATGTACLLIDTDVFKQMAEPWFSFERLESGPVGEDVGFCYKAGDLGYEIYVDTTVKTEHLCTVRVSENFYRLNQKLQKHNKAAFTF